MSRTVQTVTAATSIPQAASAVTLHYSITVNNAGGAVLLSTLLTIPTWYRPNGANAAEGPIWPSGVRLSVVTAGREVRVTYDGVVAPVVGASARGDRLPEGSSWWEIFGGKQILQNIKLLADVDATVVAVTFFA